MLGNARTVGARSTQWTLLLATLAACDPVAFEGPLGAGLEEAPASSIPMTPAIGNLALEGDGIGAPVAPDCSQGPAVAIDGVYHSDFLQGALDVAPAGATITLCPTTYIGTFVAARPVRLVGTGADTTRLESFGSDTVLTVPSGSAVSGLEIRGGDGILGGGLRLDGAGELLVENCVLRDNRAEHGGGLWTGEGASLTLVGTTIVGNTADSGGGLVVGPGSVARLVDSVVTGNLAAHEGGGVSIDGGNLFGGEFTDNVAAEGGGIAATGDTTIAEIEIVANHADFGSGVAVRNGVATMAVLRVENNGVQTDAQGGGLGCVDSDLVLYGSIFSQNRANQGGGLHATGCEISGGTFESNSASSAGSAVLVGSMLFQATVTADPAGAASSSVWLRDDAALVETRVEGYVGAGAAIEAGADAQIVGGAIVDNTCGLRVTGTVLVEGTSILRNDAGACLGGASELAPGLVSVAADWGTGSDDNAVDVRWDADYTAYGVDASFSCAEGCE